MGSKPRPARQLVTHSKRGPVYHGHTNGCWYNHRQVFKCKGCQRWCCWCFGGDPDPRCDDCVAGEAFDRGEGRG